MKDERGRRPKETPTIGLGIAGRRVFVYSHIERETHFLRKPLTPASLARKVREALTWPPADRG